MNSFGKAIMSATLFAAGSTVALHVGNVEGSVPPARPVPQVAAIVPVAAPQVVVPSMTDPAAVPHTQGFRHAGGSICSVGTAGDALGFEARWAGVFGSIGNDRASTCMTGWATGYLVNPPAAAPVA